VHTKAIDRKFFNPVEECKSYSLNVASGLVALAEGFILLATGSAIYWYYLGGDANFDLYTLAIITPSIAVVAAFYQARLYDVDSICNPFGHFPKALGILAVTFLVFLALAFALKISTEFSRVWVFSWFLSSASLIFLGRLLSRSLLWQWARAGRLSRKIVLVGTGEQSQRFLKQVQQKNEPWLHLIGIFDDRNNRIDPSFMEYPVLGTLDDLLDYVRKHRVDDIVITLPFKTYLHPSKGLFTTSSMGTPQMEL